MAIAENNSKLDYLPRYRHRPEGCNVRGTPEIEGDYAAEELRALFPRIGLYSKLTGLFFLRIYLFGLSPLFSLPGSNRGAQIEQAEDSRVWRAGRRFYLSATEHGLPRIDPCLYAEVEKGGSSMSWT